jgi:hypothetical protein
MPSHRSTPDNYPSPPFGPSAHPRCGSAYPLPRLSALGCLISFARAGPTMPSADFCEAVREDSSALSPIPVNQADRAMLPRDHGTRAIGKLCGRKHGCDGNGRAAVRKGGGVLNPPSLRVFRQRSVSEAFALQESAGLHRRRLRRVVESIRRPIRIGTLRGDNASADQQ